jgi:hypothetical protein
VGSCVSVHSATKSARIWDLIALRGVLKDLLGDLRGGVNES